MISTGNFSIVYHLLRVLHMSKLKHGLLQVYTGNGKGKTTAAIGQAIRAIGHGLKVYMIQFMKGKISYGELKVARKLKPHFVIKQYGRSCFVIKEKPANVDIKMAEKAIIDAEKIVASGKWDIVILDEINVALDYKLISIEKVIKLIKSKPPHVELIFTGRDAPAKILELADLVSKIREVKHPFQKGIKQRIGIEY